MSVIEAASTAERPPRATRIRAAIGWLIVAALVIGGAFLMLRVAVTTPTWHDALDPEGVGETGAMALAELVRDQGIDLQVYRSRTDARAALDADTTLVMANPVTLSDDAISDLIAPAKRVVFLSSGTHLLTYLDAGDNAPGAGQPISARCDAAEFAKVGTIRPDRMFAPAAGVQGCFGDADAAAVLLADDNGARRIVVEGARLFSNGHLAENGNAALGLALLAQTEKVAWYVPSLDDTDYQADSPTTLGSMTPDWLTPAIVLLMLAGVAAALWRGRRFGPLVSETLPVMVRASETMHGRARLTAKAADSHHAADALRDGSRRRLARKLGLAVNADPREIADAASDRLRIPRGALHELLAGDLPANDPSLILFARQLAELETSVDNSGTLPTIPPEDTRDR